MNAEKLTQMSVDAVRKAQSIAVMQSNSIIEPVHILAGQRTYTAAAEKNEY